MSQLVFLVEQTALGLYILIGVGVFWYWRRWIHARFSYRATAFELERDLARYQSANALTALILLVELGLVVSGIQRVVAPTLRKEIDLSAPVIVADVVEDGVFATPTPPAVLAPLAVDASGIDLGGPEAQVIFVTPTLTPTLVGTILPNMPAPIGCDTPNAFLQIPANGMRVFQPIPVVGSAFIDDFSSYKLEIARPGFTPAVFDDSGTPLREIGNLSQFNPAPYDPGMYQIRLMVFDITGTLRASCQVTIEITAPIPTPTPLGG